MAVVADRRHRLREREPRELVVLVGKARLALGVGEKTDLAPEAQRGAGEREAVLVAERLHRQIEARLLAKLANSGILRSLALVDATIGQHDGTRHDVVGIRAHRRGREAHEQQRAIHAATLTLLALTACQHDTSETPNAFYDWDNRKVHCSIVLDTYARWGIKGVKVDFMDRDDQQMVAFYQRLAAATARWEPALVELAAATGIPQKLLGAGAAAHQLVRSMLDEAASRYVPVGLLDDQRALKGVKLQGVPVLGTIDDGDYDLWRAHYSQTASSGAAATIDSTSGAVPEPTAIPGEHMDITYHFLGVDGSAAGTIDRAGVINSPIGCASCHTSQAHAARCPARCTGCTPPARVLPGCGAHRRGTAPRPRCWSVRK